MRWKKILFRTGVITLLFTSNYFIATEVMRAWEVPVTRYEDIHKKYDFGVLLTGVTKTEMTPKDRVYFNSGADRATQTLQLYKLGIIRKIIISGGSGRLDGSGVKEADDLADFLKMAGVPGEDLIIENESKNTHESAEFVKTLLESIDGPKELLLITSGYHIPRAHACFKKAGLVIDSFAANPISEPRRINPWVMLVPSLEAMGMWQTLLKEWVGFIAYWFAGYI
ncbi:MAG TPA: YdcF family protein [Cyclobacteriaceae bacterium]|nr:YdcF family protein [Cyclobacteriaceae bacterium]